MFTTANRAEPLPVMTLTAAVLGFFIVTFDAVVVNIALPTIRRQLGGGITGLQWVIDGYTLMFAALLLTAGAFADRVGARRAFCGGLAVFLLASTACGLSGSLLFLISARFLQGSAAAIMMPSSMSLVREAYPTSRERAKAFAIWAMGGAVASTSAPILGGLLTLGTWRLIFFVNIPVGLMALLILARTPSSPIQEAPIDWPGQLTAALAMGGMVFGAIEAGKWGLTSWPVVTALSTAAVAIAGLIAVEQRTAHPMLPPNLLRLPSVRITSVIGFAFMTGYYGLPFVFSLYFQQLRGLSAPFTGVLFLPMFVIGLTLTPVSARLAERFGARSLVTVGLMVMSVGLLLMALVVTATTLDWQLSTLMVFVGLGGPLVMPMTTAMLLDSVPATHAGTASGIFNSARQVGGALAIAVFGALLANNSSFVNGQRLALFIAAAVLVTAAFISRGLTSPESIQPTDLIEKGAINA